MTLSIAREPLVALREAGLESLLRNHHSEVAHDQAAIPLDVNWPFYAQSEADGRFVAWGARTDAGDLVGYNAFFFGPHPHYQTTVFATNDVIFLNRDQRGVDGLRLILTAEKWLKEHGAAKKFYHVKLDFLLGTAARDSLSALEDVLEIETEFGISLSDNALMGDRTLGGVLQALGYIHTENQFGKLLAEAA